MLKASNNHLVTYLKYIHKKVRPFCKIKNAKIAKKCGKIFLASILESMTPNERRDQMHSFGIIFIMFCAGSTFQN